ncbi:hypothetical protein DZF91_17415 [Actinomadura logoneensis]|uniref:Uncharacterized protein n=1 Tax=Actinomadura logoneensis TaxID=2293572 RepID=A0A372JK45_9ACTN|nr:hypothetical protein [Actinomadura logoneensis]RFU40391.1 hypothetical protein DZF91_17415 [Actinomadura logoneensis]
MTSSDLRKRLENVDETLRRLRGEGADLGEESASIPQDYGDAGQDLQMRQELQGQIAELEAERDRIRAELEQQGSPDRTGRPRH